MHLYIAGPDSPRAVAGRVSRCERRDASRTWPFELAVDFAASLVGRDQEIANVAEARTRLNRSA